ncbi:G-protein alpha subunit [Cyathus striatus]|nr:G-protein alpha subunit [Cyathus striatus]
MKAKACNDALQQQIDQDNRKLERRVCKVLLLGTSSSERSMIDKQMKIYQHRSLSHEELMQCRPIVYASLIESVKQVIAEVKKLGFSYESRKNQVSLQNFRFSTVYRGPTLNCKIAKAIEMLWKDPVIAKVMDEHSEFCRADSANYFCTEVKRIGEPDYLPNQTDILIAQKMYGVTSGTRFMMGVLLVHVCDVDHRQLHSTEKWTQYFENVTSILFCASLSGYDQILEGDKNQSELNESMTLFEAIINSRWFLRTSVILLFTNHDIFKLKIMKSPLEQHFPEYSGGCNVDKATKHILWKFMMLNRAKLNVFPHVIEGTFDNNIIKYFFGVLKETILQKALHDAGIL